MPYSMMTFNLETPRFRKATFRKESPESVLFHGSPMGLHLQICQKISDNKDRYCEPIRRHQPSPSKSSFQVLTPPPLPVEPPPAPLFYTTKSPVPGLPFPRSGMPFEGVSAFMPPRYRTPTREARGIGFTSNVTHPNHDSPVMIPPTLSISTLPA